MKVFVDASALIALGDQADQYHSSAAEIFLRETRQGAEWFTTNFVMVETINHVKFRVGHHAAETMGNKIRHSRLASLIWVDEALDQLVWEFFNKHRKHAWSYVDCASFVVMRRENIYLAFAFDEHFRQAGFQLLK